MSQLSRSNIFDAGLHTPRRSMTKRIDPETGEVHLDKRPYGRYAKYVCTNGHVRYVRLTNAPGIATDARYEKSIRTPQTQNGGVPYAVCPLRDQDSVIGDEFFPVGLRDPCKRDQYSEDQCCEHVTFLMEHRSAENVKRNEERQARLNRSEIREQKKLDIAEQNSERLAEVLGKLIGETNETKRSSRKG